MDIIRLFSDGFPLTIERLQFLQNTYGKAFTHLSKVAGTGKLIIDGAVVSGGNVSSGSIIVDGEVLEFEGGVYDDRVAIFETTTSVPYNIDDNNDGNLDLKVADVVRVAKCASTGGVSSFDFSELKRVQNLLQLMPKVGDIKMIARAYDPLVDIGWDVLDMTDTFPMGAGGTSSVNGTGGANTINLTEPQMPAHTHSGTTSTNGLHNHNYQKEDAAGNGSAGSVSGDSSYDSAATSNAGAHSHNFTTDSKGSGADIDNRPKFKAFNFLIFVGF